MARTKQEIDQSIINSIFPNHPNNPYNSNTSSPTRSHHSSHHHHQQQAHLGSQTSRPTSAASSTDRHKDPALLEAVRDTVQFPGMNNVNNSNNSNGSSSGSSPMVTTSGAGRGGSISAPNTAASAPAPVTLGPVEGEILNISGGFGAGQGGAAGGYGYSKSVSTLGGGAGVGSGATEEVVDEKEGVVRNDRVRFDRSVGLMPSRTTSSTSTTTLTTAQPHHRIRRSQSSSSADFATLQSQLRHISPGTGPAPGEKKPSRHADVIDQWDLTGVGKSMWHHSGPYDAAAPSRNDARERAGERAPMMVFDPTRGSRVTELDGRALGYDPQTGYPSGSSSAGVVVPGPGGRRRSIDKGGKHTGKLSSTPPNGEDYVPTLSNQPIHSAKPKPSRHASSPGIFGSLQEEYSSSMPASGGYLSAREGMGVGAGVGMGGEEEDSERRVRQKEREQKRRALQAAWGTDEPEPYEDFGGYPSRQDGDYVLNDDPLDNEFTSPFPTPGTGPHRDRPLKSPNGASRGFTGLIRSASRGGAGKSPMSPAEGIGAGAGGDSYFPSWERKGSVGGMGMGVGVGGEVISPGVGGANGKGLKRTKSLMQRIKAMRDNPNVPVNEESGRRSSSPNAGGRMSPWKEDTLGIMNSSSESMENGQHTNGSTGRSAGGDKPVRKNSLLGGRRRPSRLDSGATNYSDAAEEVLIAEQPLQSGDSHKLGGGGAGYQPTSSSQIPANPRKASGGILTNGGPQPQPQRSRGLSGSGRFGGRDKALPPPPPPAPVFQDFEGEYNGLPGKLNEGMNLNEGGGGAGVQRKPSLMKKFKGKVGL